MICLDVVIFSADLYEIVVRKPGGVLVHQGTRQRWGNRSQIEMVRMVLFVLPAEMGVFKTQRRYGRRYT
jgi:hypothetical protein